eukprot:gene12050-biopygen3623
MDKLPVSCPIQFTPALCPPSSGEVYGAFPQTSCWSKPLLRAHTWARCTVQIQPVWCVYFADTFDVFRADRPSRSSDAWPCDRVVGSMASPEIMFLLL